MVTLKKWTVDELLGMEKAGLLDPEKKLELIDGKVYEMSIGGLCQVAEVCSSLSASFSNERRVMWTIIQDWFSLMVRNMP